MNEIIFDPTNEITALPTRRSLPKQWKLDSIDHAFANSPLALPRIVLFERGNSIVVADGNHRVLMSMKYQRPICGIQLAEGEEFILHGNPDLNYGKHRDYTYQNFGVHGALIDYCRIIALFKGYKTFQDLFNESFSVQTRNI